MPKEDDLPPLSPLAGALLAGLILVVWVALRVSILRRLESRRQPDDPDVPAWRWLRALARSPRTNAALTAAGVALLAALAWAIASGR